MTEYTITLTATVTATLNVIADNEEDAKRIALADVGAAEYDVDFTVESIEGYES